METEVNAVQVMARRVPIFGHKFIGFEPAFQPEKGCF